MPRFFMHPAPIGRLLTVFIGCCAALATPRAAWAQDFETVPGASPFPSLAIGTQYIASDGVTFSLANNTLPILAKAGPPLEAFSGACGDDTAAPGSNVGEFFLIDPQTLQPPNAVPSDLTISYNPPVPCARGVILDIDQAEAWTITAYDSSASPLGTVVLNTTTPGAGDCQATPWSFFNASASIAKVIIKYTGATQINIGYAWDNFETVRSVGFETLANGTPASGVAISNQFWPTDGVAFSLANNTLPILAKVGSPLEAFNSYLGDDTASSEANMGQFFLIDPKTLLPGSPKPSDLVISYITLVSFSKGVILDIDQAEAWTIKAFNGSSLVGTIVLTPSSPGAGDGLATPWSFSHLTADISKVVISYTGSTQSNIGYGWDNMASAACSVLTPVAPGLAGIHGIPILAGNAPLVANSPGILSLTDANPSSPAALFAALASTPVPFKGGVLTAYPVGLMIALTTDATGGVLLPFTWPPGVPTGTELFLQYAVQDAAAVQGVSLSNALKGVTP